MRVYASILAAAILATPQVMAQDSAPPTPGPTEPAVNVNAPRVSLSTAKLLSMRNAMAAQIAAYDTVDQTWRAPTASEQEQLSQGLPGAGAPRIVTLSNGAVAAKGDAGEMSFLTVELQPDGALTMGHAAAAKAFPVAKVPTPRLKTMGGRNEQ